MRKLKFILVILILIIVLIFTISKIGMTYIKSVNGKKYLVQNTKLKHKSANTLGKLNDTLDSFVLYLSKNKTKFDGYDQYIDLLMRNTKETIFSENTKYSRFTSYSVNKGEELVFCLKSKNNNTMHNHNLLMYVALHELSHIACPEKGHTKLFNKIFRFLITEAIKLKIYKKINFSLNPVEYCGMIIVHHI